jgi:hypothetical protein
VTLKTVVVPIIALTFVSCFDGSLTGPTPAHTCTGGFDAKLTRDDGSTGVMTYQAFIDGRPWIAWTKDSPSVDVSVWLARESDYAPGHHIVEVVIVDQPISPTNYALSNVRVQLWGTGGAGSSWLSCGTLIRTIALPGQTATLATGERFTIHFDL